jgi:DNA replication initiation complex subunit (GINS family)
MEFLKSSHNEAYLTDFHKMSGQQNFVRGQNAEILLERLRNHFKSILKYKRLISDIINEAISQFCDKSSAEMIAAERLIES